MVIFGDKMGIFGFKIIVESGIFVQNRGIMIIINRAIQNFDCKWSKFFIFGLLMMSNGENDPFGNKRRLVSTVFSQKKCFESEKIVFEPRKSVSWQLKMQHIEKCNDLELELMPYYYKSTF